MPSPSDPRKHSSSVSDAFFADFGGNDIFQDAGAVKKDVTRRAEPIVVSSKTTSDRITFTYADPSVTAAIERINLELDGVIGKTICRGEIAIQCQDAGGETAFGGRLVRSYQTKSVMVGGIPRLVAENIALSWRSNPPRPSSENSTLAHEGMPNGSSD